MITEDLNCKIISYFFWCKIGLKLVEQLIHIVVYFSCLGYMLCYFKRTFLWYIKMGVGMVSRPTKQ